MTLTLSKDTIQWLLEMQEKFDSKLRVDKGISDEEWGSDEFGAMHGTALYVEKAEIVNECFDLWKYWKSKKVNFERILDEGIDCIHFLMLVANKYELDSDKVAQCIDEGLESIKGEVVDEKFVASFTIVQSFEMNIAILLRILNHYGFTEQDIIEQYKRKNAINFERLESGY